MSESAPSFSRRVLAKLAIDLPVLLAIASRFWQFLTGPVTVLLIVACFSEAEQGLYYTFGRLVALQVFFELSLHVVVLNVASHEWANLRLDAAGAIEGDADSLSRLVSLGRAAIRFYLSMVILFIVLVGGAGVYFFASGSETHVDWAGPWWGLTIVTGVLLLAVPFTAILEGCDQLAELNRCRLRQAVFGSLAVWGSLLAGAGLWATVVAGLVRVVFDLYLVGVQYRRFFAPFFQKPQGQQLDWKTEIWPLQWRLGIEGALTWFVVSLMTPVIYRYHSPDEAGRMGLMWTVITTLQMAALSWVDTRRSKFGQLIARRAWTELDRMYRHVVSVSFVFLAIGSAAVLGVVLLVPFIDHPFAAKLDRRLLDPVSTGILLAGILVMHFPQCQNIYIRAHKRDPFFAAICVNCVSVGVLVWWSGFHYGSFGAAVAWTSVISLFMVPCWAIITATCRKQWHSTIDDESQE